ncbi:MAG: hypothetical protein OHK0017_02150 [Patescibacteria group bacterium]
MLPEPEVVVPEDVVFPDELEPVEPEDEPELPDELFDEPEEPNPGISSFGRSDPPRSVVGILTAITPEEPDPEELDEEEELELLEELEDDELELDELELPDEELDELEEELLLELDEDELELELELLEELEDDEPLLACSTDPSITILGSVFKLNAAILVTPSPLTSA